MEIGSEFWLDAIPDETQNKTPNWLNKLGDTILTSSGRGAISLLLQQVAPKNQSVLLPEYICESVILPFIENGYTCNFYKVNKDLSPDIESIRMYRNVGIFLHMGYFGFFTNSNLIDVLQNFKKKSTIIIEDITHTLFSGFNRFEENDFYVGSIRKWFGVPSGGFLASSKRQLERPVFSNVVFPNLRTTALLAKGKYVENADDNLKDLFLNQFAEAENLLDMDVTPYHIENISSEIINLLNIDELVKKRRNNFMILSEGLKSVSYMKAPFNELRNSECPMFYPILINNRRDEIRKKLTEEKIYCPIHWPVPNRIRDNNLGSTLDIYNMILSIPCDQRYGTNEMEKIISVLKSL